MALSGAVLHSESALWYYRVLEKAEVFGKIDGFRWSDYLFQLPTVLALQQLGEIPPLTATRLLALTYTLHPFISLCISYAILRRQKSLHLLNLQLFSLAVAVMPTLPFSTGVVAGAVSFFWPFYFYLNKKDITAARAAAATAGLCVVAAFSHESALFLLLPLIRLLWLTRHQQHRLTFVLPALTLVWIILHIAHPALNSAENQSRFLEGIIRSFGNFSFAWVSVAAVSLFAAANLSAVRPLYPAAAMLTVIALWLSPLGRFHLSDSRDFRVLVTLLTAAIALIPLKSASATISFFICVMLLNSSLLQIQAGEQWGARIEKIQLNLNEVPEGTCLYADDLNRGVEDIFVPILLQNTYMPKKVLLPKSRDQECALREKEQNPCIDFVKASNEFYNECYQVVIKKSSLKFNYSSIENHQ